MVSIKEVAEIAGVSIATVSRYINNPEQVKEHTRNKVKQAISSTGYAPNVLARNFRRGKTHQIVVVIPAVGAPFFESVLRGIWKVAHANNYSVVIRETCDQTIEFDEFSRLVLSKQADGIILLASVSPFHGQDTAGSKQPPVVIGLESFTPENSHFPGVRIDSASAASEATQHLLDLGHQHIAFIYGRPNPGSTLSELREEGFRHAMHHAGLEIRKQWLRNGKMTLEGGRAATREILQAAEKPTAILCANDEMALGALHEIKRAGLRVPEDISIVGFDNIRYSEISDPPLTTIAQPAEDIGMRVMRCLFTVIDGNKVEQHVEIVPHQLIIRGSTAPPRG